MEAGLLELVAERKKRGTTERYLRAIARRFDVDGALFSEGSAGDAGSPVGELFRTAQQAIVDTLNRPPEEQDENCAVVGAMIRGVPERVEQFRTALFKLLEDFEVTGEDDEDDEGAEVSYGLLIALYPEPTPPDSGGN